MVENARYTESGHIAATIDGRSFVIPDDMANRHRQMVAEWEAAGNTIPAYEPPPLAVPEMVYPFQARKALLAHGLLDAVNNAVELAGPEAQIAWEYAIEVHRNDPLIESLGAAIGLTSEQIDDLFIEAHGY